MKVTNSKKAKKVSGLQKLLQQHKGKFQQLQNGKIKCTLTGHEFMPSEQNLNAHLNSKSFKKASEAQFDITEYEDVLETHKDGENFLFCRLTGAKVPKKKTAIEKHVNGKRFKSRFQEYKAQLEQEEDEELIDEEDEQQEGEDIEEQEDLQEQEQEQEQEEQQKAPLAKKNSKPNKNNNKKPQQQHKNGKGGKNGQSNGHQKQKKIKKNKK